MSKDEDINPCRLRLAATITDVRKYTPSVRLRDACVRKVGRDHWVFHYGEFQWHGSAGNAYEARANGWSAWLAKEGIVRYWEYL